jgi:hypothetical protein
VHLLITVNAAWNIWNFRRSLVAGLLADGHRITILAPPDARCRTWSGWGAGSCRWRCA